MSDRRPVRLMCEYSARWPLWDGDGPMDPAAPAISPELTARLYAWQEFFEKHFDHELGWRTPGTAEVFADEGRALQRLLTAAAGRWFDVELDLWPVTAV